MDDPYKILGISRGASEEEIQKAYKKLAMQYHPDRNPGDAAAEEKFKTINAARDAIKNGNAQPQFQTHQHSWSSNGFHFGNLDDILRNFHQQHQARNRDLTVEHTISLEEAFNGTEVNVNIHGKTGIRQVLVKIPPGVDTNTNIKISQAGDHSMPSMQPGDLFVLIRVRPHEKFNRTGPDLTTNVVVDVFDIMLGGTYSIVGIDSKILEVKIPANFDPSRRLRLSGHGMPILNSTTRGDLLISVIPKYTELSEGQRALIQQAKDFKLSV